MNAPFRLPRLRAYDDAATDAERLFGLRVGAVRRGSKRRIPVMARHALWVALHRNGWSVAEIGRIGQVDHTTVLHALKIWPERERKEAVGWIVDRLQSVAKEGLAGAAGSA